MEVEGASPGEAGSEALVDGFDLARETVGGDDDLFAALVEVIKDVEKFFLGFFLIDNELEVVDNETVESLELGTKFFTFAVSDRVDKVGVEVGNGGIEDFVVGVSVDEFVADGLDKMGFAESWSAIEEERVTASAGGIDDAFGSGDGNVVVGADDKTIDGIFGVKTVILNGVVFVGFRLRRSDVGGF